MVILYYKQIVNDAHENLEISIINKYVQEKYKREIKKIKKKRKKKLKILLKIDSDGKYIFWFWKWKTTTNNKKNFINSYNLIKNQSIDFLML